VTIYLVFLTDTLLRIILFFLKQSLAKKNKTQ